MSILPIDIQISIQKTDQHTKDFDANARVVVNQHGITNELQRQITRNQRQVVSTSATSHKRIDRDSQSNSGFNSKQRKNKKRQEQNKGNRVDITV